MTANKNHPDNVQIDLDVIDRYLAGDDCPEESLMLERTLYGSNVHRDILHGLRTVSYSMEGEAIDVDTDAQWQVVSRRIGSPGKGRGQANPVVIRPRSFSTTIRRVGPWAALTAMVMMIGVGLGIWGTSIIPSQVSSNALMAYSTGAGQRSSIELADGTRVLLNVGTRVRIPENFSSGNRTVHLTGEAYFQVAHAAGNPFVVESGNTRTTVLGTEFGVRAYEESPVRVAVQSGKVSVNNIVLNASEVAEVNDDGEVLVSHEPILDSYLGFINGKMILRDIPLRDAILDLNRWYDADIRLDHRELGDLPIRAVLRGESIAELMTVLRLTFGIDVVRNGRTLTLSRISQ